MPKWTDNEIRLLREHYPQKGLKWCADFFGVPSSRIRSKASLLGLKQDRNSEFFKEWQSRAKRTKIGKKRPTHSAIMKEKRDNGHRFFGDYPKTHRKEISTRMKEWSKTHPHPRGALGMKHSAETLEKLSITSKRMWENMSEAEKDKRALLASKTGRKVAAANRLGKTTWKAAWREIGGRKIFYRSRWEANYARYLEWLRSLGEIASWEHEAKTFWFEGIKRGCLSYLPDFRVVNKDGGEEYHEVKGWMDARSKTTINRMRIYHPNVKLIVIDSKGYKAIQRKVRSIIPNWE